MSNPNIESRREEIEMLGMVDGMTPEDIMAQVTGEKSKETPAAGAGEQGKSPEGGTAGGEAGSKPDETGILKEIFGDQFTSKEDLINKNIPGILKEHETLRQQVQALTTERDDLSGKLKAKPKTAFVNDEVALFNEFVRETGINNFGIFNSLNGKDIANMDYMDAIMLVRQMENPDLIGRETQLRKHIEKVFNVDPEQVDAEELEVNKIGLAQEGVKARAKLQEIKGKLKIPEPDLGTKDEPVTWTPEQETQAKTQWGAANKAMSEKLAKIPIFLPNTKEPLINFDIPKEKVEAIEKAAFEYAINNRMEINENSIKAVANYMYSELILGNLGQIAHSIFEKARSMTQEEALKYYHNPSKLGGEEGQRFDQGGGEEDPSQKIFNAEMGRT